MMQYDLEERITELESRVKTLESHHPKPKPWYKHFGKWLAIVLTLAMVYMLYCFYYMSELGYEVFLPW